MSELSVVEKDVNHITGTLGNVAIVIWRQQTLTDAVQRLAKLVSSLAGQHGKACLVQVVEVNAAMPDSETRSALAKLLADSAEIISSSAVVYEGEGLRAASVRGIVTSLTLLAKPKFPHKIFATVPDAASWYAQQERGNAVAKSDAELTQAIQDLRKQLSPS